MSFLGIEDEESSHILSEVSGQDEVCREQEQRQVKRQRIVEGKLKHRGGNDDEASSSKLSDKNSCEITIKTGVKRTENGALTKNPPEFLHHIPKPVGDDYRRQRMTTKRLQTSEAGEGSSNAHINVTENTAFTVASQTISTLGPPQVTPRKEGLSPQQWNELIKIPLEPIQPCFKAPFVGNASYLQRLRDRGELGYWPSSENRELEVHFIEINHQNLREAFTDVLNRILLIRYYDLTSISSSSITAEIAKIVPVTVDVCMSALYAKLRNINCSYGKHGGCYSYTPSYTQDINIPHPFALAIQEFGMFQTHSLGKNRILIPTFKEDVKHEGRVAAEFPSVAYISYLSTYQSLGIPLKSVDPEIKSGSPWWTFKVVNILDSTDLAATLPRTHYSDFNAILRSVFCAFDTATDKCKDIVEFDKDVTIYGTLLQRMILGFNLRAFSALIHGPKQEWSSGLI